MTDTPKERKPRRTLTYDVRLRELDEAQVARAKRDAARVAECEAALEAAQAAKRANEVAYAERRAKMVADALAKSDEIRRQVNGE